MKLKPMQTIYCLSYDGFPQEVHATHKLAKLKLQAYFKNGTHQTNQNWSCHPVLVDCDYKLVRRKLLKKLSRAIVKLARGK